MLIALNNLVFKSLGKKKGPKPVIKKKVFLTLIRLWINAPNIESSMVVKNTYSGEHMLIFFFNSRTNLKYSLSEAEFDLFLRGIISIPASSNLNKFPGVALEVSVIKAT